MSRMETIGLPASPHLLHFLVVRLAGLELPEPRGRCAAPGPSQPVERRYDAATSPAILCCMQTYTACVAMESQKGVVFFLLVQLFTSTSRLGTDYWL